MTDITDGAVTIDENGKITVDMAKADALWNSLDELKRAELTNMIFQPVLEKAKALAAERDALAIVRDGLNELLAAERKQNAELYDAVDWDTFDCGGERGGKLLRMFGGGLSDKTDPKSLAPPAAPSEQDNTTGKETT